MKRDPLVYKFLRSVAGTNLDSDIARYIKSYVKKNLDWYFIYQQAESERIPELLYYHLEKLNLLNNLPASINKKLENAYNGTIKSNLNYRACLLNIEEILRVNDIRVIVLQGLSVLKLYGDPGLRSMSDMDILVKPEHMDVMLNSLKDIGFQTRFSEKTDLLIKDNMLLDIHTHPLNINRIRARKNVFPEDITGFWERASSFSGSNDQLLLSLDIYDSFLCLSAHASKHCYCKLILLCDLNELLQEILKNKDGWNALVERARVYGLERLIVHSLMILELVYQIPIPGKVKRALDFDRINIVEKRIVYLVSRGADFETAYVILWFFSIRGVWKKLQFLKETIFPGRKIMASMVEKRPVKIKVSDYCNRLFYMVRMFSQNLSRILTGR